MKSLVSITLSYAYKRCDAHMFWCINNALQFDFNFV